MNLVKSIPLRLNAHQKLAMRLVEFTELTCSGGYLLMAKLKWAACSRWSSSLYCPMRNSDQMTIETTHPTLLFWIFGSISLKIRKPFLPDCNTMNVIEWFFLILNSMLTPLFDIIIVILGCYDDVTLNEDDVRWTFANVNVLWANIYGVWRRYLEF